MLLKKLIVENQVLASVDNGGVNYAREGMIYAIVIVAILPIILFYPFVQRFFVKGLTVGAVKG